jgi:hypothetical protein
VWGCYNAPNGKNERGGSGSISAAMQNSRHRTFVLLALIAGLLIINTIAISIIVLQRRENASLRAQLLQINVKRPPPRPRAEPPPPDPNAFVNVAESAIPGRYTWIKSGEEKGVITLNADHSFANEKGEKFKVYQWDLAPDALTLMWQRGPVRFTVVEASGTYVALRRDGQTERLEKVE